MIARDAYFWARPMVNVYNRRLAFGQAPERGLMNGVLPFAPLNAMSMLNDYVEPNQRWVACPNQDLVYGAAIAALEETPVVVQVPDFGGRFWVYQVVDLRTDGFAEIGAMWHAAGLLFTRWAGLEGRRAKWHQHFPCEDGTCVRGAARLPRDTPEDKRAIQEVIAGIDLYSLAQFDGKVKRQDYSKPPALKSPTDDGEAGETKWVFPYKFFDELPVVLKDAPPLPGEEARYGQIGAVLAAAQKDSALKTAMIDEATKTEKELVDPLLQFRNWGVQLPNHWSTTSNNAAFGTDYFARTAVAKSNILVNAPAETK